MPVRYGYNPITGTWVALSEVMNGYPFATPEETMAGVVDSKAVTPADLAPALAGKANVTDVNAAMALKADITYTDYLTMEGDPA